MKSRNITNETKQDKKPTKYSEFSGGVFLSVGSLVYKKFSRTSTIHPGIFLGWALFNNYSPKAK